MAPRPIFHRQFGRYLERLRKERKGWSQSDAARFGKKKSAALTRQVLLHLEAGKTKDPEREVLRALADLYGEPYEEMIRRLSAEKYALGVRSGDTKNRENADGSEAEETGATAVVQDGRKDRELLEAALPHTEGAHGSHASLASTREAIERAKAKLADTLVDLDAIADGLPRRQAPVDRPARSKVSSSRRKRRGEPDRQGHKKASS